MLEDLGKGKTGGKTRTAMNTVPKQRSECVAWNALAADPVSTSEGFSFPHAHRYRINPLR